MADNPIELQVTFNKYTIQKLNLLEIMVKDSYNFDASSIEAIARDHGVTATSRMREEFVLNLLAIISGKLLNYNDFIAKAIEKNKVDK